MNCQRMNPHESGFKHFNLAPSAGQLFLTGTKCVTFAPQTSVISQKER